MALLQHTGTIVLASKTGSDEPDEYGMPQEGISWGPPIPCMYRAVTDDKRGVYTDGTFNRVVMEVHIDLANLPAVEVVRAQLFTLEKGLVGLFPVQSVTLLRLTGRAALSLGV